MLLVIFGAGASYDSVEEGRIDPDRRPPLAAQLFAMNRFGEAVNRYRESGVLVHRLDEAVREEKNVENALEQEVATAEQGHEHRKRQLIALRYYLRLVVGDTTVTWGNRASWTTNYSSLLDRIELWRGPLRERVLLVTFNYDLLLDEACLRVLGLTFPDIESYTAGTDYKLFKPHGSVDWSRVLYFLPGNGENPDSDFDNVMAHAVVVFDSLKEGRPHGQVAPVVRGGSRNVAALPALAVPTHSKTTFECPLEHLEILRRELAEVDRVLVVGWRGQENHFVKLLNEFLPEGVSGLVASGSSAAAHETAMSLGNRVPRLALEPTDHGFSQLVKHPEALNELLPLR
jgi:hypothetical protein